MKVHRPPNLRRFLFTLPMPLLLWTIAGCAELPTTTEAPDTANLQQRAQAFWAARVMGDVIKAYDYEQVKATKAVPLYLYAKKGGLVYQSAQVGKIVEQGPGYAKLKVRVRYRLPGLMGTKPIESDVLDRWVPIGGLWYHAPCHDPKAPGCAPSRHVPKP